MIPETLVKRIETSGIIAVLVIDDPDNAVPLARTLVENGIDSMELTLRTDAALESLRRIRSEVPSMLAGLGTVLKPSQIDSAVQFGAEFAVAPGFNPRILEAAGKAGIPFAPGIATPSDIEGALEFDCRVLKFFHAEGMGGVRYLKGINAPYAFLNLRYIPLGGLKPENARDYLRMPEVLAIGGSWIAPRKLIAERNWSAIGKNAAEAAALREEVRSAS